MSDNNIPLVLVTGVSGYIGTWVAYTALKLGYKVRGTVRSISNENKISHLRDLCPSSKYKIELVEADLNSERGWNEAVQGATFVLSVILCLFFFCFPHFPLYFSNLLINLFIDMLLHHFHLKHQEIKKN